jgi:hypothetical protein
MDTNHLPVLLPVDIHIDGDTIKGPRCDGYPFLAENVDPAYIKLFAAAPAMLAALKDLHRNWLQLSRTGDGGDLGRRVRAVINSAEGR